MNQNSHSTHCLIVDSLSSLKLDNTIHTMHQLCYSNYIILTLLLRYHVMRAEINCLKNLKLVLHFLLKLMISLARLHFTR